LKALTPKIKDFKRIGINKSKISLKFYEKLKKISKAKFFDVGNFLLDLRSIKLRNEIELIKKSARIANKTIRVIEEALISVKKGKKISEREITKIIEDKIEKKAKPAFPTIVASNIRTASPHPFPPSSLKQIRKGIGFVDFGVSYKGYCVDITIPWVIGKMSMQERKIFNLVMDAYNLAIYSIKEGKLIRKVFDEVNNFLIQNGFELVHTLGHGIGLEVHEKPFISKKIQGKEEKFKKNMVFTLEPAIYLKDFGWRIENNFLLSGKKIKTLTHAKLIEV
jgi:Xaa-Pro aminopeptidase